MEKYRKWSLDYLRYPILSGVLPFGKVGVRNPGHKLIYEPVSVKTGLNDNKENLINCITGKY